MQLDIGLKFSLIISLQFRLSKYIHRLNMTRSQKWKPINSPPAVFTHKIAAKTWFEIPNKHSVSLCTHLGCVWHLFYTDCQKCTFYIINIYHLSNALSIFLPFFLSLLCFSRPGPGFFFSFCDGLVLDFFYLRKPGPEFFLQKNPPTTHWKFKGHSLMFTKAKSRIYNILAKSSNRPPAFY